MGVEYTVSVVTDRSAASQQQLMTRTCESRRQCSRAMFTCCKQQPENVADADDFTVDAPYKTIDYILVYEDTEYTGRPAHPTQEKYRELYFNAMLAERLEVEEERVGKYIFVKVHCPFDRLCKAAEDMRMEIPLDGMIIDNNTQVKRKGKISQNLNSVLAMDDSPFEVTAPFQNVCREWFMGKSEDSQFFSSGTRCLLVHYILINIDIGLVPTNKEQFRKKQGLPYLLLRKVFTDAFILHDLSTLEPVSVQHFADSRPTSGVRVSEFSADPSLNEPPTPKIRDTRRILKQRWIRFCKAQQPLELIKNYFGEKIAFYFAWIGTLLLSLWVPAVLGVIAFAVGVGQRLTEPEQIRSETNETLTKKNVLYYVELLKASSDSKVTPFFALIVCLWGSVFSEVWKRQQVTLSHRWHVDTFDMAEPDRPQYVGTNNKIHPVTGEIYWYYPGIWRILKYCASASMLLLMVFVVFISVTSVILFRVYTEVSWCEHDSMCMFLTGTVLATFLNTISIMLLGQIYDYIAVKLTDWENHRTESSYNDALVIKLFAFQFANTYSSLFYTAFFRRDVGPMGILGLGPQYQDNCGDSSDNCMSLLSFQLLVLMIVKPLPKFFLDIIWPWLKKMIHRIGLNEVEDATMDNGVSQQHYLLREMYKPTAGEFRRGEMNEKVIQYGYLMMFASSFPLAPLLALIINMCDLHVDARRLLWWNRRPIAQRDNDIGMWLQVIDFINICGVISNGLLIAFSSDFGRENSPVMKLVIVIGFEHLVFALKFLITALIPNIPASVQQDKEWGQFFVAFLMSKMASISNQLGISGEEFFLKSSQISKEKTKKKKFNIKY